MPSVACRAFLDLMGIEQFVKMKKKNKNKKKKKNPTILHLIKKKIN
jgi:hypothetical protein